VGSVESYGGGLTDRIYEASVLPEKWPEVLRQLTDLAHGVGTVLLSVRGNDVRYLASTEVFQTVVEAYFHAFPGVNERMKRLLAIQRAGFVSDSDVFSPAELESEPIFKNFLTPRGYGNGVASVLTLPNNELILFHTEGVYARGPLDAGSIAALNSLRAHLARSSFISSRLSFERARTAVETLSGISLAACAVTRSGTVLVANEHFSAERGYWTTRGSNKIAAMDRRVDGMLQVSLSNIHYDAQVRSLPMISVDGKAPAVLPAKLRLKSRGDRAEASARSAISSRAYWPRPAAGAKPTSHVSSPNLFRRRRSHGAAIPQTKRKHKRGDHHPRSREAARDECGNVTKLASRSMRKATVPTFGRHTLGQTSSGHDEGGAGLLSGPPLLLILHCGLFWFRCRTARQQVFSW
jgi:hypothetical protein